MDIPTVEHFESVETEALEILEQSSIIVNKKEEFRSWLEQRKGSGYAIESAFMDFSGKFPTEKDNKYNPKAIESLFEHFALYYSEVIQPKIKERQNKIDSTKVRIAKLQAEKKRLASDMFTEAKTHFESEAKKQKKTHSTKTTDS